MSESLKEKILDKVTDELLGLIFNTTKDELEQLMYQGRRQKILHKTILDFYESDYFKREFSDITCNKDKELLLGIDDSIINISLPSEELNANLLPYLSKIFVTDNDVVIPYITTNIVNMYIQRAKSTTQLYEVICAERSNYEKLDKEIITLQNIIIDSVYNTAALQIEKESLLKKELHNEMSSIISEIMQIYIFLICKTSPILVREEQLHPIESMANIIQNVIDDIGSYINEDFCTVPVVCDIANGLEKTNQSFPHLIFNEYFKDIVLKNTDVLMKYKDEMPLVTLVTILRLRDRLHGPLFPSLLKMGQTNIIASTNITIDVIYFRDVYLEIGSLILELYQQTVN